MERKVGSQGLDYNRCYLLYIPYVVEPSLLCFASNPSLCDSGEVMLITPLPHYF